MIVRVMIVLGTLALVGGMPLPAAAQSGAEDRINSFIEPQVKGRRGDAPARPGASFKLPTVPDTARTPPPPAPPAPAPPATPTAPGGNSARPAPPSTPAAPTVAPRPPGLSHDAPESAPTIGVIGGTGGSKGGSPASTPEPTTLLLMGAGLAGLYGLRRRRS